MATEDETVRSAICNFLHQHFYQLYTRRDEWRSKYPQNLDFIDQHLSRYATNVFSLLPIFENVFPSTQAGLVSQINVQYPYTQSFDFDSAGNFTREYPVDLVSANFTFPQYGTAGLVTGSGFSPSAPTDFGHSATLAGSYDLAASNHNQHNPSDTAIMRRYCGSVGQAIVSTNNESYHEPMKKKRKIQHCCGPNLRFSMFDTQFWMNLKSLIESLHTTDHLRVCCDLRSISSVFKKIEELERKNKSNALRRRILLYHFAAHREQIIEEVQEYRLQEGVLIPRGTRKSESEVLDQLVTEIFPHTIHTKQGNDLEKWREKHKSDRKKIKNRWQNAKNWWKAVNQFSLGVLYVIPCNGDFKWQDHEFERLSDKDCEAVFAAWLHENSTLLTAAAVRLSPLVQVLFNEGESFDLPPLQLAEIPQTIDRNVANQLLGVTLDEWSPNLCTAQALH